MRFILKSKESLALLSLAIILIFLIATFFKYPSTLVPIFTAFVTLLGVVLTQFYNQQQKKLEFSHAEKMKKLELRHTANSEVITRPIINWVNNELTIVYFLREKAAQYSDFPDPIGTDEVFKYDPNIKELRETNSQKIVVMIALASSTGNAELESNIKELALACDYLRAERNIDSLDYSAACNEHVESATRWAGRIIKIVTSEL